MQQVIHTIGHSNHKLDYFYKLLDQKDIDCVVDVRNIPYSSYNSQFNKLNLAKYLKKQDLEYLFLGEYLGPKYRPSLAFVGENIVDFAKVRQTEKFKKGIRRLLKGWEKGFNIALMCAEKDPFDCHRAILIAPELKERGIKVKHILAEGSVQEHKKLEEKLVEEYVGDWRQTTLFGEEEANTLEIAYRRRNKDMG